MQDQLIWYVSYGSNLLRERFLSYIVGGYFPEFARDHRGCPDRTLPRADVATEVPGRLFFAGHTERWDGAVAAFIDTTYPEQRVKARAYLITQDQFEHILGQECNVERPVRIDLTALRSQGCMDISSNGLYFNQLVYAGDRDGYPLVTFTSSGEDMTSVPPSPVYTDVVIRGLMQSHGLTREAAHAYIAQAVNGSHLHIGMYTK